MEEHPMAGIIDMVAQLSQGDAFKKLGSRLGIDQEALDRGVATAMPLLVSALANNASTPDGAQALHGALARDHDGSAVKNPATALANADTEDGGRILGHVLGDRQEAAQQALAKATGMDSAAAARLLATLAPLVMGALGHLQQQHGLDAQGLSDRLDQEVQKARQAAPGLMDVATRLLDRNQDGSILDDVSGFVGKLFEKR
jgi:hypothetical protein